MDPIPKPGREAETSASSPASSHQMDMLIRAGLVIILAVLCYQVFSPFLALMAWSVILAVTMYPLHQRLARWVRGKQWLASTIMVMITISLIIVPTGMLMNSFADSVRNFIIGVQNNTLEIPAPSPNVEKWPVVGKKVHGLWMKAHTDLPGLVKSMQPKIGHLAQKALSMVASIGGGLLLFIGSFIVASIIMAYGDSGEASSRAIFQRISGVQRGDELVKLSTATIRAVALGVMGVAFIQAILIGLALLLAGVPAAGLLSIIALILGIAQVPALLLVVPVLIYIWSSGDYSNTAAITYTVILLLTGMTDNILKPIFLGRGVDVPMPVILFGALGGIASGGILGMFVGATVLALGYKIFEGWVVTNPSNDLAPPGKQIKQGDSGP